MFICIGHQPRYTAANDAADWHVCMSTFSYILWCAWRVIYCEGPTQNLTSVCTLVKSTSTWSTSPGPNSPTSLGVWCSICQWQESTEYLSRVFSEHSVSRLSYIRFCQLWETGTYAVNRHSKGFFTILQWFCLISKLSQTQFDDP
jgi:hypothetical protein